MSPIRLSRKERAALRTLVRRDGRCKLKQLKETHAERFIRHGLLARAPTEYQLTIRGQVEVLRQRYRRLRTGIQPVTPTEASSVLHKRAVG